MQSSKALDILVAQKFLGLVPVTSRTDTFIEGAWVYGSESVDIKPYSTDIAAAAQLVTEFQRRHLKVALPGDGVVQVFREHPADHDAISVKGESDAHALCLAALRSVGAL